MNSSGDDDMNGGISFPVQLYLTQKDVGYHVLDDGKVNRGNVTDDSIDGFLIQITLEKVIHGDSPDLATFIGFNFRFRGINDQRRFRYVEITIRFEDEEKPLEDDPEVMEIWPHGDCIWSETPVEVEDQKAVEGGIKGGQGGGEGSIVGRWQQQQKFVRGARAVLSGDKVLRKRKSGNHKNAVLLTLSENAPDRSGVLGEFRAGILLARKSTEAKRFRAHFNIEAKADMRYTVVNGLQKLVGAAHITDPVTFEASHNYYGQGDTAGINTDKPTVDMVRKYGDAVSWTQLVSVGRIMARDQGQWKEVRAPAVKEGEAM